MHKHLTPRPFVCPDQPGAGYWIESRHKEEQMTKNKQQMILDLVVLRSLFLFKGAQP